MVIKGLTFIKTCGACPEQCEVFLNDQSAGYVRLRYGILRVDYPECLAKTIYTENYCWVVHKGFFGKYKIRQCYISNIWYTNIWGFRLDNGWMKTQDEIGKTVFKFEEKGRAIEKCLELNEKRKVKIKYI